MVAREDVEKRIVGAFLCVLKIAFAGNANLVRCVCETVKLRSVCNDGDVVTNC